MTQTANTYFMESVRDPRVFFDRGSIGGEVFFQVDWGVRLLRSDS